MHGAADSGALAPGKQTLTPQLPVPEAPVQRRAVESTKPGGAGDVHAAAAYGMGAEAFATGDRVAFAGSPDLHTAAHEAAHVVQQRAGVQLKGGVGEAHDRYEQHANAVADAVAPDARPRSCSTRLSAVAAAAPCSAPRQLPTRMHRAPVVREVAPPTPGIDKPGFIDRSDGAFIRTGPAEAGGALVDSQPLPPATRVFVSGTHPSAPEWAYVTAYLDARMVRGYVQSGRVNTDLPEPTAKLHQVVDGDAAEKLAVQEYKSSIRDGHDLRYYESVLLYVNQQQGAPASRARTRIQGFLAAVATT